MYADKMKYHLIPLIAPVDTASATLESDVFDAGEAVAVEIQVAFGVITGDTVVVTIEECDDIVPTNQTAIAFKYRLSSAVGTDSMGAIADAAVGGVTVADTDDNKILEIFVDPQALSDGYPYLRVVADPGGSASVVLAAAVANILPRKNPPNSMVD